MKKLIVSLCMLLVAVALLGTSTYAWFSMNTRVQAQGMQVQAITSKDLVISTTGGTPNTANEGFNKPTKWTTLATLTPASTYSLANNKQEFFKTKDGTGVQKDGKPGEGTEFIVASTVDTGTTGDVAVHTFYIRAVGPSGFTTLFVDAISIVDPQNADSAPSEDISKALRIGVVCGNNGYIYAPLGGNTTYRGLKSVGTLGAATTLNSITDDVTALDTYTNASTLGAVSNTAYSEVKIYIWYEGQDTNCTTDNAVHVEQLKITVRFAAEG